MVFVSERLHLKSSTPAPVRSDLPYVFEAKNMATFTMPVILFLECRSCDQCDVIVRQMMVAVFGSETIKTGQCERHRQECDDVTTCHACLPRQLRLFDRDRLY